MTKHNFEIGDRVRIRGAKQKGTITIRMNPDKDLLTVKLDSYNWDSCYHYECVIRLKKKEKLRVWVNDYHGGLNQVAHTSKASADRLAVSYRTRCLRFVLEGVEED